MALRDQLRIMVVDDTATSRGLITHALESFGIQSIATAGDGKQAVQMIARAPVHLVVSDYNMPEMTGVALARRLRALTKGLPVVFMTGADEAELLRESRGMKNTRL
ncbi:MAG: response regulator, partial [Rhodobacteraceae bacterium]|nr:response regulator [Paracoccaceae bacterium]